MSFWPVFASIVALAVVYVMVPVGLAVFSHFRHPKRLRCPQSGENATVVIDPGRAGLAAVAGGHSLTLRSCSLLDGRFGCGEWCTRLDHGAFHEVSESSR
jgi:hypothetical protein